MTIESPLSTDRAKPTRQLSDWAGFIGFIVFSLWLLWSGWLPVVQRSILAGFLILPSWLTPLLAAVGFLGRKPLLSADRRWLVRINAYFVTFSIPLYFALMHEHVTRVATGLRYTIAVAIFLVASVLALSCTWTLRRAMSIEPQARSLITTGPYEYARHPLYSAYLIHNTSTVLLFLDLGVFFLMTTWVIALLYRIRCEERVLTVHFPEYADYKHRVWMFSPRLWLAAVGARRREARS